MSERLKRIGRLVAVQRQLHQLNEWKLARLREDEAERVAAERDLVEALNGEASLAALFAEAVGRIG